MKKVFLTVLTLGFLAIGMVSCQSDKKDKTSDDSTAVASDSSSVKVGNDAAAPVTAPTKEEIANSQVAAPSFSNDEVNEGIKEFSKIKEEYVSALESKNADEIKAAKDKYNAWVTKAATWGNRVSTDENQKYIEYYQKLVRQWDIAGRQAAKK